VPAEEGLVGECSREALDPCPGIRPVDHVDCLQAARSVSMVSSPAVGSAVVLKDLVWVADWHKSDCAEQLPHSGHFALGGW